MTSNVLIEALNSVICKKIEGLELGINTTIYKEFDEFGIEFSGGESQKVAISRVLYADKPILIFDEPTSSLEPIAEYDIINCLNDISHSKTVIYITHRMSLTHRADKIIVIPEGYIKETGSYEQLMNINNGIYKTIFKSSKILLLNGGLNVESEFINK